jgi:hypothetical protein
MIAIEDRYIVLKLTDLEALVDTPTFSNNFGRVLTKSEETTLNRICKKIRASRDSRDKPLLKCLVVEADWPEYEVVWGLIKARIEGLK